VYFANQKSTSSNKTTQGSSTNNQQYQLPPEPSVASQCSSELSSEDEETNNEINSLTSSYNQYVAYYEQEYMDSLGGDGGNNSFAQAYIQDAENLYQQDSSELQSDYQNYKSNVSGYVPLGGSAGDCSPDLSQPTPLSQPTFNL
jgi:hypothetical protein